MPISREEFDGRGIDFKIHILGVLLDSPEQAFHWDELLELVQARIGLTPNEKDFAFALRHLEVQGDVRRSEVKSGEATLEYWTINTESGS